MDDSFMLRAAADLQAFEHDRCATMAEHCHRNLDIGFITAVRYWGVPKPEGCTLDDRLIHTVHQQAKSRCRAHGVRAHMWTAGCDQIPIDRERFTVASPPNAWCQVAATCTDEALISIGSAFLTRDRSRRVCSKEDIEDFLDRTGAFTGKKRCLTLLSQLVENTDSPPEVELFRLLSRNGIGPLTANARVDDPETGERWFLDAAITEIKVGFEYQGGYHAGTSQMRRDAHKLNRLNHLRWNIILVTADHLRSVAAKADFLAMVSDIIDFQRHLAFIMGWIH